MPVSAGLLEGCPATLCMDGGYMHLPPVRVSKVATEIPRSSRLRCADLLTRYVECRGQSSVCSHSSPSNLIPSIQRITYNEVAYLPEDGLHLVICYTCPPLLHIEARTGFLHTWEISVTKDLCLWVTLKEILKQHRKCIELV